jgi:hypothetical protein
MKKMLFALCLALWTVASIGCATRAPKAPLAASGQKIQIQFLCDRGDPATMESRQFQYRQEVGAFMERDLLNRLNKSGYEASQIQKREEFKSGPDRYLLTVKITMYNPGSTAARMMVGYGAGAASMNTAYQLFGADPQPVLEWTDGCGTSEHWSKIPRKLDASAVKKITEKLAPAAR